jgi:hypothetical protein
VLDEDEPNCSEEEISVELKEIIDSESRMFPLVPCLALIAIFVVSIIYSLLKGGRGLESLIGIEPCSAEYWTLNVCYILVSLGITGAFGLYILHDTKKRHAASYTSIEGDLAWSKRKVLEVSLLAIFAGLGAGLLGIGGGLILGPFMLGLGLNP